MTKSFKQSGQKLVNKLTKIRKRAGEEGREHIQENVVGRISHVQTVRLLILEWSLLMATLIFFAVTQAFWYRESYVVDTYKDGGTYSEATLGKVNSLNPLFATTNSEKSLSRLLFATLSSPDYSGHTAPNLAASIKSDETGKIWTAKLRDNLKWSDGEPITNADVLYTIKIIQDSTVRSSYSSNLSGVKVSEEDGNLIFTLSSAFANFPSSLDIPILPSHILSDTSSSNLLEHSFSSKPVTSGPFSFKASQSIGNDGEKIVYLTRNDHYFMRTPLLENFTIHAYLSSEDIKTALKSGTVAASAELPPGDTSLTRFGNLLERQTALSSGVFAFLNMRSSLLSDVNLRRALQVGIDTTALRESLNGEQALNYPITDNQISLKAYPAIPTHNQTSAKELIAKSEISEDAILNIATISSGKLPELANQLAGQLNSLGLKTSVQIFDPNQDFLINIVRSRNYDILLYEIELGADPDLFAYYHSSQASETGLNLSNYRSTIVDDLVLAARSTMDSELRAAKYEAFLRYWIEDVPAIGIYQTNLAYYVNKNVRTFSEENRLISPIDRFIDVSYWGVEKTQKNRTT